MKAYPCGTGTYSKHPDRYPEGTPQFAEWARGPYVSDGGHNKLIDLTSGLGAVLLGHQHPDVDKAIRDQMKKGVSFPLPNRLEHEVAERLLSMMTWERAESVRFGKNGADVTTSAVRLARAVTGRQWVLYFDYHGHHDWSMTEPPWWGGTAAETYSERHDPERDDRDILDILDSRRYAAVVLEPAPSNAPDEKRDFTALRKACDEHGTLLILDEMVSGFRAAPGGCAELYGIEPDLMCLAKCMANGLPLSAVVGPWDILKRYEEDVFFSLTHAGEALSLAAANETLRIIGETDALKRIGKLGSEIIDIMGDKAKSGYPQRIVFDDIDCKALLEDGVLCAGYANFTLAHADVQAARERLIRAFQAIA